MKLNTKIIILEGLDGSGKSTLCYSFKKFLLKKGIETEIVGHPTTNHSIEYYDILQEIEAFPRFKLARTNFRMSRLYVRFNNISDNGKTYLFDRGILSMLANADFDNIQLKFLNPFLEDYKRFMSKYKIGTVLLDPGFSTCISRIERRIAKANNETSIKYLKKIYELTNKNYESSNFLGYTKKINTNNTKEECIDELYNFWHN